MAERLAYLEAVVGADITEFRKSMRDIRNDVGILSETISGIGGAARTMTFAFTTPMVALGTYAVQAASGFDGAMRNINSILQLSEKNFGVLEGKVMDFAKTTRDGVVPATEALYEIFSAGIVDQEKAMAVWQTSTKVAEAGLADLSQTTNAMTATMNAYALSTSDAERVGNIWTRMVQVGVGSLGDFLSNAQKILPASAALNISLEDMGATIAYISQVGGGAAKAETGYSQMLSNLMKPTEAMTKAFDKLGVATGSQLISKFGSVAGAIQALKGASDEIDFAKMFSKSGGDAARALTGNVDALNASVKMFNDNLDTATMDAWTQQSKSFAFQWDLMKTSLEAVAITIGQAIMPLITPLIKGFSDVLQQMTNVNPELVTLGVLFVGAVAAAAPLIWLLTSLLNPIGLIIAGVTTLGVAVGTNFDGIRTKILQAVQDITGGLQPLKDTFDTFMAELFPKEADIPNSTTPIVVDVTKRITVTKPMSLWEIYTKQGYDKQFSWAEFMKEAKAGGWKGGVVKLGDEITITGGDKLGQGQGEQFRDSFQNVMHDTFGGMSGATGQANETTITIFDRLQNAIDAAWPKLKTALNTMWGNFTTWVTGTALPAVDTAGSDIINRISGWFDTSNSDFSGQTGVYKGVTEALTADVGGAVKDAGGIFGKAFPKLTSALKGLFDSVGKWIVAEGVPTVARSIGFMAGRMASMLGDAISGVWGKITGQDGANSTGKAADAVNTAIFQPLNAGIQDGIDAGSTKSPFNKFLDGIGAALLLAAGAWVIAPTVVTAIATPIIGVIGAAFTTALTASGTAAAISGLVKGIGVGMATAFSALSVLGIGALIIGALLSNEDIQKGLSAWAGVWDSIKTIATWAVDRIAVGLRQMKRDLGDTLNDIVLKINMAKLAVNPGDNAAFLAGQVAGNNLMGSNIAKGMEKGIDAYLQGYALTVDLTGAVPVITGATGNPQATQALLDSITDPTKITQAITAALSKGDAAALQVLIPITLAYDASQGKNVGVDNQIRLLAEQTGLSPTQVGEALKIYYKDNPVMLPQIEASLAEIKLKATSDTKVGMSADMGDDFLTKATANSTTKGTATVTLPIDTKPMLSGVDEAIKTWADSTVSGLPTAVTTAVTANSGNMTAAADSMTKPFVDAFAAAFAPSTGTVTTQWTTFLTGYVTDITTMQTTTATNMPLIQSAVVTAVDTMKKSMVELNKQLEESANRLDALVKNSPYTITVKIETQGTMPSTPAGATGKDANQHGAVGINRVPFDGYQIWAHKGEMLLNKNEADNYQSQAALPQTQTATQVDNSSPTFIVNGVQDFDQFMREAKRRGYNLDKFRR